MRIEKQFYDVPDLNKIISGFIIFQSGIYTDNRTGIQNLLYHTTTVLNNSAQWKIPDWIKARLERMSNREI